MKQTPALPQLLARLTKEGGRLEAQAIRAILRAFKATDPDAALLLRELAQALLLPDPVRRFAQRERLLRLAAATFPDLPPPFLAALADAVTLGGNVGAGMLAASGAPAALTIVAPAVEAAVGATEARALAWWGDQRADHAARLGRVMTAALGAGGRYPVRAEIQRQLDVSRAKAAQLARDATMSALSEGQASVWDKARDDLGLEMEKTWLHARQGPNSRPDHVALDGKTIDYSADFIPGVLARPHDPRGGARHNSRCRCSMSVRVKGGG